MEEYKGVKFKVIPVEEKADASELLDLDKFISGFVSVRGAEGNASIRHKEGFLIKRTGSVMTRLKDEDVVFVQRIDGDVVYASGGTPSSEARLHWKIYENRKDVNIILHFHDREMLDVPFDLEIGPFEYGTPELADAAGRISVEGDVIKVKEHGFIVIAESKGGVKELFFREFRR